MGDQRGRRRRLAPGVRYQVRAAGNTQLAPPDSDSIAAPVPKEREEVASAPLEADEPVSSPTSVPPTSITVRWSGDDIRDKTAVIVLGHGAFMDGASGGRSEQRMAMVPTEPRVAEAVFRGVLDDSWSVAVEDSTGGARWAATSISEAKPDVTVEFSAGTSHLDGTVWNKLGQPVAGAKIYVQSRRPKGNTLSAGATTGPDGRYEIRNLHGGAGWFSATEISGESKIELADHVLAIPKDQTLTVNVGSPVGSATVMVEIVDVAGEAVMSGTVTAYASGRSETTDAKLGDDGKAELSLSPGTWNLLFWGRGAGISRSLDEFEVAGGGTLKRRLVLPGARIVGRLEWAETLPHEAVVGRVRISLRSEAGSDGTIVGGSMAEKDGRFRFDGVAPGTYWLTTHPNKAASEVMLTLLDGETSGEATIPMSD